MKKILLAIFSLICLSSPSVLKAQSFSVAADTVNQTVSTAGSVFDRITNLTGSSLKLNWHVVGTNFPADWLTGGAFGLCDNSLCRQNSSGALWNGTSGTTYGSTYFSNSAHDSVGDYDLSLDLSSATTIGCFWITVNISDANSSATKNITFVVCKPALGVPNVNNAANDIVLYPNPAHDELNIVFGVNSDIKNIAVYNIIGKVVSVYKVNGDSANLNLENMPSGIYFVRLVNSHGDVVVTRKFTKQ